MNYLPIMTEDEIKYVCLMIPLQESVLYFKQHPKDFAKVMPGFRATSLRNQEQLSTVLFRRRSLPFVSSFIEKHISRWLEEIQQEISESEKRNNATKKVNEDIASLKRQHLSTSSAWVFS